MLIKIEINSIMEYFKSYEDAIEYLIEQKNIEENNEGEIEDLNEKEEVEYFEKYQSEPFKDSQGNFQSPYSLSEKEHQYYVKTHIEIIINKLKKYGYTKTYQGKFGSTWERKNKSK